MGEWESVVCIITIQVDISGFITTKTCVVIIAYQRRQLVKAIEMRKKGELLGTLKLFLLAPATFGNIFIGLAVKTTLPRIP